MTRLLLAAIAAALFLITAPTAGAQVDYSHWTTTHWMDNAGDIKWNHSGTRITFSREVTIGGKKYNHVWEANGDGSDPVDLMPDETSQNMTADWSADGQKIVFCSDKGEAFDVGGPGGGPGVNLWVMNADGSQRHKITTTTPGGTNYRPYWSHNGRRLLWTQAWWRTSTDDFVWQVHTGDFVDDADGGHIENIQTINPPDTAFYEGASWDVGDQAVLFSSTKSNSGNYELYRHNLATGAEDRLTRNPEIDISGHPSPDGRWIAFTSSRDDHSLWSYYTDASWDLNMPPLLDNVAVITADTAIAWIQPFHPQGTDIYLMHPDGSGVTRLTQWENQIGGGMPNWAPDGCHIATSPSLAQRIAGQEKVLDGRTQVKTAYLLTFAGCGGLPPTPLS